MPKRPANAFLRPPIEGYENVDARRRGHGQANAAVWGVLRPDFGPRSCQVGDAATISGYLGKAEVFDQAIGEFARDYAGQAERDHATLANAERSGRIQVLIEENL